MCEDAFLLRTGVQSGHQGYRRLPVGSNQAGRSRIDTFNTFLIAFDSHSVWAEREITRHAPSEKIKEIKIGRLMSN